ncbi:MAG: hypothetical protein NUV88_02295 [Candidatus Kaiserbacteria bacterium]|nr:hypothetical protein [Candidatus Kaiserbacteria bacterium]
MGIVEEINTSGSAYLVAGSSEMVEPILLSLEETGIDVRGTPDIYIREYLQFGIDEARELRSRATSRAIKESHRIFIIISSGMTADAQNALLKTLEEPRAGASFYFVVSSPDTLLPTLLSRIQMLSFANHGRQKEIINANDFLRSAKTKRIDMLKQLLPKDKEVRDTGAIIAFLSSLERDLGKRGAKQGKEGLNAIYLARKYAADKGSMLKPLLEQVALLVP